MEKLKPCPFCGNNPVIVCLSKAYDSNYLSKIFEIICKGCGAKGQNVFRIFVKIEDDGKVICDDGEKQRAINAWNRRTDMSEKTMMRKHKQKKEDVNIASYQTQELSKQIASLLEMFHHLMRLFEEEVQSNRKNEEEIKELKIKVELLTRLSQCCSKCDKDLQ